MAQKRSKGQGGAGGAGQKGRSEPDERDRNLSSQNIGQGDSRSEGRENLESSREGAMNEPGNPPGQEGRDAAK